MANEAQNKLQTRLHAAHLRKTLVQRHPPGSAVRRILEQLDDEHLVAADRRHHAERLLRIAQSREPK